MPAPVTHPLFHLALLLNRLAIGVYLAWGGVGKITGGVSAFVENAYMGLVPDWLPDWFAQPYGHAIPYLEVALGVLLVIGLLGRTAAALALVMIGSFTYALAVNGPGLLEHGSGPYSPNLVYLSLLVTLAVAGPGRFAVDAIIAQKRRPSTQVRAEPA
jgi:uncharacterized membrane protein YphA (DoxX/SURF4 family)